MSKMTNKYSFEIAWSDEDNTYVACCPEFPGSMRPSGQLSYILTTLSPRHSAEADILCS
jgi:hypothetical protein